MQKQNLMSLNTHFLQLPCDICADQAHSTGKTPFVLYGSTLNLEKLLQFQQKCGENFTLFACWQVFENTLVLLQGHWRAEWQQIANQLNVDCAELNFTPMLSQAGLLVMDMDSTVIEMECIDEIAKLAGTGELVSKITERAMQGELDFEQSLRQRVATLANASEDLLQQVRQHLPLIPGLIETIQELQKYGWKTAIASGGFTYFADHLKALLNLDYAVSNQFEIIDGKLTGQLVGDIVDAQYKATTLQKLAQQFAIPIAHTVAIGDGANDLLMMKAAGVGVAYHAKPKVQQQAQVVVNSTNLTALICLLSANEKRHLLIKE